MKSTSSTKVVIAKAVAGALALTILLALGLVACDAADEAANGAAVAPAAVARLAGKEVTTLAHRSRTETIVRTALSETNPRARLASLDAAPTIERIGPEYFLVGRGQTEDGRCVTVAVALAQETDGSLGRLSRDGTLERPIGGHACAGNNCSGCNLAYSDGHWFCTCWMPGEGSAPSWCDHSCSGASCY